MTLHPRSLLAGLLLSAAGTVTATFAADSAMASHEHRGMDRAMAPLLLPVSTAHTFSELMANVDDVMHDGMANAKRSGNPDHDFASTMIPHHQGAIDMARVELLYGRDPVLRRMAQEIIVSQQQEITVMQRQLDTMPQPMTTPSTTSPKAP